MKNLGLKLIILGIFFFVISVLANTDLLPIFGTTFAPHALVLFFRLSIVCIAIGILIPDGLIEKKLLERKNKKNKNNSSNEEDKD